MLVSDKPASQATWVAVVIVKAERTAAMARTKRILLARSLVEVVGQEGESKRLIEKVGRKGCLSRIK